MSRPARLLGVPEWVLGDASDWLSRSSRPSSPRGPWRVERDRFGTWRVRDTGPGRIERIRIDGNDRGVIRGYFPR